MRRKHTLLLFVRRRILPSAVLMLCTIVLCLWSNWPWLCAYGYFVASPNSKFYENGLKKAGPRALPALDWIVRRGCKQLDTMYCGSGSMEWAIPIMNSEEMMVSHGVKALPYFHDYILSESGSLRLTGLSALADLGPQAKPAVPDIKIFLSDSDPMTKGFAIYALARIEGNSDWTPRLFSMLQSENEDERDAAVTAARLLKRHHWIPPLTELLLSSNAEIQYAAARILGVYSSLPQSTQDTLTYVSRSGDRDVRAEAARTLCVVHSPAAFETLHALCRDPDPDLSDTAEMYMSWYFLDHSMECRTCFRDEDDS